MKSFENLHINELIDLLARSSAKYSKLKREMASDREVQKYKTVIESLMTEIEKRKRATIAPYNNISGNRSDDRMKTA